MTSEEKGILHMEHPEEGVLTTRPPSKQDRTLVPDKEVDVNKVNSGVLRDWIMVLIGLSSVVFSSLLT